MADKIRKPIDLPGYKKVLYIVFGIHIFMFMVSFSAAFFGKSSSVLADSIDFIGDAASYASSMYVITKSRAVRAYLSIAKAITMLAFSLLVIMYTIFRVNDGTIPSYEIMGVSGVLGIISHLICVYYLYRFRKGDSNQMSSWVCTINDLISNTLTVIAAYFVMITNSIFPDIISAFLIVGVAIYGAITILKQATKEIKDIGDTEKFETA
jgi:Co/Zn/Cd efflux system component